MDFLTVDWDFFVPERPEWDMGHQERELFLSFLWQTRGHLLDLMVTSGEEKGFWDAVLPDRSGMRAMVSDSYSYAYAVPVMADRVVLFDAHHDCWGKREGDGSVYCHDWLRRWLEADEARTALWMYPSHLTENWGEQNVPEDLRDRVERRMWTGSVEMDLVESVHVCRSGCWTPPWLDAAFLGFLKDGFGRRLRSMQGGAWDPTRSRWDAAEAVAAARIRDMLEKMKVEICAGR